MKRPNYRRKQRRRLTIIQGILVTLFFISMSAMDSRDITIPAVAFVASGIGLFITSKLEEGRK